MIFTASRTSFLIVALQKNEAILAFFKMLGVRLMIVFRPLKQLI